MALVCSVTFVFTRVMCNMAGHQPSTFLRVICSSWRVWPLDNTRPWYLTKLSLTSLVKTQLNWSSVKVSRTRAQITQRASAEQRYSPQYDFYLGLIQAVNTFDFMCSDIVENPSLNWLRLCLWAYNVDVGVNRFRSDLSAGWGENQYPLKKKTKKKAAEGIEASFGISPTGWIDSSM